MSMCCLVRNFILLFSSKIIAVKCYLNFDIKSCVLKMRRVHLLFIKVCHNLRCGKIGINTNVKICYDKAGNLPNKGRNFNTQTWGKIVYFLFV